MGESYSEENINIKGMIRKIFNEGVNFKEVHRSHRSSKHPSIEVQSMQFF